MDQRLTGSCTLSIIGVTRLAVVCLVTATLIAMPLTIPATAASQEPCQTGNGSTGLTYEKLQDAVAEANPGDVLTVVGKCRGATVIDLDLTITGARETSSERAILVGRGKARVVTVEQGATVTLRDLTIRGGRAERGGGLLNRGRLTLDSVRLVGNSADYGGGVWNEGPSDARSSTSGGDSTTGDEVSDGTLTLMGSSRISGNEAGGYGGGVLNLGSLDLRDSSSISDNTVGSRRQWAGFRGGGVYNYTILTLNDSSTIRGNRAREGGGVANEGTITLHDSSSISGTDGGYYGGGVDNDGTITLSGSSSISGNTATKVYGTGVICGPSAGELGGGVNNRGALTLRDSSIISGNKARYGGGVMNRGLLTLTGTSAIGENRATHSGGDVYNEPGQYTMWLANDQRSPSPYSSCPVGTLVMRDSSSISDNTARKTGGGVLAGGILEGVTCQPSANANVRDNAPDDCAASAP